MVFLLFLPAVFLNLLSSVYECVVLYANVMISFIGTQKIEYYIKSLENIILFMAEILHLILLENKANMSSMYVCTAY